VNVAGVNLFFCSVTRFAELRDALEKLQLNDAALKVSLYTDMLENIAFFCFSLSARGHNLHFSVYAITFCCSLLFIIIVLVLVRIDLTMNSPFLLVV
jgi:hypothetical protein